MEPPVRLKNSSVKMYFRFVYLMYKEVKLLNVPPIEDAIERLNGNLMQLSRIIDVCYFFQCLNLFFFEFTVSESLLLRQS